MASNKHPGGGGAGGVGGGGGGGAPLFTSSFPPQSTATQPSLNISHAVTTTPTPSLHLSLGVSASSRLTTASPLALPVTLGPAPSGERITLQPQSAHSLTHASLPSSHITAVRVVSIHDQTRYNREVPIHLGDIVLSRTLGRIRTVLLFCWRRV